MKNIFKGIMGIVIVIALLCMIVKGYKSTDIVVAFISMAISTDIVIDGMDYILDRARKGD